MAAPDVMPAEMSPAARAEALARVLLRGGTRADAARFVATRTAWALDEPALAALIDAAEAHIAESGARDLRTEYGKSLQRLEELYRRSLEAQDFKACAQIQRQIGATLSEMARDGLTRADAPSAPPAPAATTAPAKGAPGTAPDDAHVSVQTLAAALDLTPRRLQQLVKDGMPGPVKGRGYPLAPCVRWYVSTLRNGVARHAPGSPADRRARAEAELAELKLAQRRGQLADIDEAVRVTAQAFAALNARIDGMRGKWPRRLLGLATMAEATAEVDRLAAELKAALRQAADDVDGGAAAEVA